MEVLFNTLFGANDITTVVIGEKTYALVAAQRDDGVQIIDITNPMNPTAIISIRDGENSFNTLDGAFITTVVIAIYTTNTQLSINNG